GSSQFSEKTLRAVRDKMPGSLFIVDLRRESHGFVNGIPISWYEPRNASNIGLSRDQILRMEEKQLAFLSNPLTIQRIVKKSSGVIEASEPLEITIKNIETEAQLAKRLNLHYIRIPVLDHHRPNDEAVDEFVTLVKSLPPDTWLYFHCRGGKGRSTTFMTL